VRNDSNGYLLIPPVSAGQSIDHDDAMCLRDMAVDLV
jgi:hypothetical protein